MAAEAEVDSPSHLLIYWRLTGIPGEFLPSATGRQRRMEKEGHVCRTGKPDDGDGGLDSL